MTVIAGILSFIFWEKLNGVREGTIIAALLQDYLENIWNLCGNLLLTILKNALRKH